MPTQQKNEEKRAKLFMHGRSQAVRLPKEFRFRGKEVRVSREGERVVLESVEGAGFDFAAWWRKLEALKDIPFPEPDDMPIPKGNAVFD
ncbi:MAG TPA: AbrB/MazE/SpoVT family DNA-binding domain-containing protein [Micropepsaceae bacterium]|nr:AbrB/MazE/SpoVT family DNA-binding domain-containing protein [Micropepsaceae bacterium]